MTIQTFRRGLLGILAAGALIRLFIAYIWLPGGGFPTDLGTFTAWGLKLSEHGAGDFYATAGFADYPPGYLYVLWFLGVISRLTSDTVGTMGALIKLPAMIADLAVGGLMAGIVWRARIGKPDRGVLALLVAALFVFNPVTIYDSALWGQVESVGLIVVLACVFMLMEGTIELALPLGMLAGLIKPQFGLILLPIIIILVIRRHLLGRAAPQPGGRLARLGSLPNWVRLSLGGGAALLVYGVLTAPFGLDPLKFIGLINKAAATYPYLSVNAYNPWSLVALGDHASMADHGGWTPDNLTFLFGLSALQVGTALLAGGLLLAGVIVAWRDDRRSILLAVTVAALAFFVLPTRVHERYLFPVMALLPLLAISSRRYLILLVVLSLAAFDNFHGVLMSYAEGDTAGLPLGDLARNPWLIKAAALASLSAFLFVVADTALVRRLWSPLARALGQTSVPQPDPLTAAGILSADFLIGRPAAKGQEDDPTLGREAIARLDALSNPLLHLTAGVDASSPESPAPTIVRGRSSKAARRIARRAARMPVAAHVEPAMPAAASESAEITPSRGQKDLLSRFKLPTNGAATVLVATDRLGRRDAVLAVIIVFLAFVTRFIGVGQPSSMYFDEVYHARTATEFLQDWRYGMPHDIYEFTHPHLAKYAMAGGIVLFGNNTVSSTAKLPPLSDAVLEPRYAVTGDTAKHGERLYLATGNSIEVYALPARTFLVSLPFPATTLAIDTSGHRLFAADATGQVVVTPTSDFDLLDLIPVPFPFATLDTAPLALTAATNGAGLFAQLEPDRLVALDGTGTAVGDGQLSGLVTATLALPEGRLALSLSDGTLRVMGPNLIEVSSIPLSGPASDLLLSPVDNNKIYAATGAGLEYASLDTSGSLGSSTTVKMPGAVRTLAYSPSSKLIHVLGRTPDGSADTVYVLEPHGNAVFADAPLPFGASALLVDASPDYPSDDPQNVLALNPSGDLAVIAAGGNATAWRLPGVIAGSFLIGVLFLLGRLLLRRRSAALAAVAFALLDGMFFASARIAMNDIYVTFFILAAYTLFAALWLGRWRGRGATLLGLPTVGLLLGLALASKWVGLYAIGGIALLILARSRVGRWLLLAGLVGVTGTLGLMALASGNIVFAAVLLGLTATVTVLVAQRGPDSEPESAPPAFLRPGPGWIWAALCLVVLPVAVYALSYAPWIALGNTWLGPTTVAGSQNLPDLTISMYNYHDQLRATHAAGSPWWAWPLDLKPVWFAAQGVASGLSQQIHDAGNPAVFWMAVPALAFVTWAARRRRDLGLAFIVIAFAAAWLPWSRIDRVTFEYHYFSALPFAVLALGALVSELWDRRPDRTALAFARVGAAVAICLPAALWVAQGPLCTISGATSIESTASICGPAANAAPLQLLAVAVALALVALSGRAPYAWRGQVVALVGGSLLLLFVAQNTSRESGFIPATAALIASGVAASFIITLRDPRRLAAGIVGAVAGVAFMLYPFVSGAPVPGNQVELFRHFLPSWDYAFQFATNTAPAVKGPGLPTMVIITGLIGLNVFGLARLVRARWGSEDEPAADEALAESV